MNYIGKYEIVSTLGRGSMGVVYKGRDPEIGRLVAIKTLKSVYLGEDAAGNEALARFRQEARSTGKLNHPNIVSIFEAGRADNGSPFMVMEYIEGVSLESMIAQQGPLDPQMVVHYLAQIAGAIDYAHRQNVIHRDIKPSNVLIDGQHRAHLLDFGVAKLSDTSLTPAGTVVGTPYYMSPEQIRGQSLDHRTDFFSLAVVAFEALTGVRPFPGNDFTTVVSNIIHKQPLSLRDVGSDLPSALEKTICRGLTKEREQRCENALEFIASIAEVLEIAVDGNGIVGGFNPDQTWRGRLPGKTTWLSPQTGVMEGSFGSGSEDLFRPAETGSEPLVNVDQSSQPEASEQSGHITGLKPRKQMSTHISGNTASGKGLSRIFALALILLLAGAAVVLYALTLRFDFWHLRSGQVALFNKDDNTQAPLNVPSSAPVAAPISDYKPWPKVNVSLPQPPRGGFTKTTIESLSDEELAVLLRWNGADVAALKLTVPEAAKRGKPEFIDGLVGLLAHQDLVVRIEVLKAFAKPPYSQDRSIMAEAAKLLDDADPLVRGFAAKTLASAGDKANKEQLEARLSIETSELVQKVINECLNKIDHKGDSKGRSH